MIYFLKKAVEQPIIQQSQQEQPTQCLNKQYIPYQQKPNMTI